MLRLNLSAAARWVELEKWLRVEVRPLTSALFHEASRRAADRLDGIDDAALRYIVMTTEIARLVITGWHGVGDEAGNPIEVSDAGIVALMDLLPVNSAFAAAVVQPYVLVLQEKKGFAPLPNGNSEGAQTIAADATPPARTAPLN